MPANQFRQAQGKGRAQRNRTKSTLAVLGMDAILAVRRTLVRLWETGLVIIRRLQD
jgi:hypothetical protein